MALKKHLGEGVDHAQDGAQEPQQRAEVADDVEVFDFAELVGRLLGERRPVQIGVTDYQLEVERDG